MANKELLGKLENMVECPVCLDRFKHPRSLPCQHSFCTECLQGLLGTGTHIRCPCCNKDAPIHNGVWELLVDFRTNTLLETLQQAALPEGGVLGAEAAPIKSCETCQDAPPCPVCEQIPTYSENLSCGHHLCGSCVQFLQLVGGDAFNCPTCSHQTRLVPLPITHPDSSSVLSQTENEESQLTFHSSCGKNAVIHSNRITAHRQNPKGTYCDALVLTSRHLKPNELFEVRLDKMVDKWSGTIQLGMTPHPPERSALLRDISNLGPDTWFMSGGDVWHKVHKEWTAITRYDQDLGQLKVGDRVGVQRRKDGDLHFYINGVDLGVGAHNVPADVYGVVSLSGKHEQVTITDTTAAVQTSPDSPRSVHKVSVMDRMRKKMTFKKSTQKQGPTPMQPCEKHQ